MMPEADREIETVRGIVAHHFPVYETRVTPQAVQFLVNVDPMTMEQKFEDLRVELVPKNYVPFLTKEGGEHTILVQRRPPQRFLGTQVNLVLLMLTIGTTMWAGADMWAAYGRVPFLSLSAFGYGTLFFTVPLMTILGVHEMGHYLVAKRYKVRASLPFFIPAPGLMLGTFGAMISMRDPMPNRKALLDIGAAGPILGLIMAIPVLLIGFALMAANPQPVSVNAGGAIVIEVPLLYQILALFVPVPANAGLHPTAFAGWVGLFVTALNLLPAGQLDGGHVARAVLGDNGKYLSYLAILLMVALGLFYPGWFIIAIFIMFLGARHPPPLNDLTRLDGKRHVLAAGVLAVLVLSFVAVPLSIVAPDVRVQFEDVGAPGVAVTNLNATISTGTTSLLSFRVVNKGNVETNVTLSADALNLRNVGLNVSVQSFTIGNRTTAGNGTAVTFTLNSTEAANVTLFLNATAYTGGSGKNWTFDVPAVLRVEGLESSSLPQPVLRITVRVE